jgi:hypothetical protein
MLDRTDPAEAAGTIGARLRTAWADREVGNRLEAIRGLWRDGVQPHERHARMILTSGAAARIPPSADHQADAAGLIASMLASGLDRQAARWSAVVEASGDDRAWALLALAGPSPSVDLSSGRIETFVGNDESPGQRRSQMLVAALAGLGRIDGGDASSLASSIGIGFGAGDRWGQAIDEAAQRRETGTVVLLAGLGMQTGDWWGVPPEHLFRTIRALRAVGLDYEARMIAAEALARL